jgi:hypothetical protein
MFGIGLDGFSNAPCQEKLQVHNSVFQAALEFGWIGGAALALMIFLAGGLLLPLARHDAEVRFVLCSLIYVVLLSMAHGRISRDALLFLFLGYAVSLHGRLFQTLPEEDGRNSYHLKSQ